MHLVTPIPASIARPLIDGLHNEVIVKDFSARRDFPEIVPMGYEEALRLALNRSLSTGPTTTWFDAYDVRTLPGEFAGLTQGMLIDRRGDLLWHLRGFIDRLVGGVGIRRGRRSATDLRIGDAVDFWRVEEYRPANSLRLRAEMKLPGLAWLQFESLPDEGSGTTLRQTAFFEPRGLFGYAYWSGVVPFHEFIFGNMATRIIEEAEKLDRPRSNVRTGERRVENGILSACTEIEKVQQSLEDTASHRYPRDKPITKPPCLQFGSQMRPVSDVFLAQRTLGLLHRKETARALNSVNAYGFSQLTSSRSDT